MHAFTFEFTQAPVRSSSHAQNTGPMSGFHGALSVVPLDAGMHATLALAEAMPMHKCRVKVTNAVMGTAIRWCTSNILAGPTNGGTVQESTSQSHRYYALLTVDCKQQALVAFAKDGAGGFQ